ncbi:MAG: IS3 family transposase [Alphaproteobacteria bacterium]
MTKAKFTDELKQEVIDSYKQGAKVKDLLIKYNISKTSIYKWVKEFKAYYRKNKKENIDFNKIYKLEKRLEEIEIENTIFKESGCGINSSIKEKIDAINKLKDKYSIYKLCKTLNILRSTFYHKELKAPKQKEFEIRREIIKPKIKEIFDLSKERFGPNKISIILKRKGILAGVDLVSNLMKEMSLICMQNRRRQNNNTSKYSRYRKNRLKQKFDIEKPNTVWVSDISYMSVKNKPIAICVIIDLFARKVIAHKVSKVVDVNFIIQTFNEAHKSRGYPKGLTFHSDQGAQYTAFLFRKILRERDIKQSFSKPGTPLDNAVAEAFFSMMKRESLGHSLYENIDELKKAVDEYINFFNNIRILRRLDNITPDEFENNYFNMLIEKKAKG